MIKAESAARVEGDNGPKDNMAMTRRNTGHI